MQTPRWRGSLAALVVAAVMVLGVGMAAAVLVPESHSGATEKASLNAPAGLAGTLTKLLHSGTTPGSVRATTTEDSENWAGYGDVPKTSSFITEVFAEWFVPTAVCNEKSGATYQVQWIGIDGLNNGNVSQDGTFDYCSGPGATPAYYTWYEFYPYEGVQLYADSSAGALISAYILYNPGEEVNGHGGVYTLELYDADNGVNFVVVGGSWVCSGSVCEGGPDGTAECISEAPGVDGGIAKLADYGTTTFYGCSATIGTHTGGMGGLSTYATVYKINQIGSVSGKTDQSTGKLSSYLYKDDTFSITWKKSN